MYIYICIYIYIIKAHGEPEKDTYGYKTPGQQPKPPSWQIQHVFSHIYLVCIYIYMYRFVLSD